MISSVYGSPQTARRRDFWAELSLLRGRWSGAWCIGGDWNAVRYPSERLGSTQFTLDMQEFFDWIDFHLLVDLQMSGANFAWSNHQEHLIMSRLDRFLVSPGLA